MYREIILNIRWVSFSFTTSYSPPETHVALVMRGVGHMMSSETYPRSSCKVSAIFVHFESKS